MAYFLASLAGRTLGSALTLQPIVAQAFTPNQALIGENDPGLVADAEDLADSVQQQSIPPGQETQPIFHQAVRMPPTLVSQGNVPSAGALVRSARLPFSKTSVSRHVPPQHEKPDSLEQIEPKSSPVPGSFMSSDHRSTPSVGEPLIGVDTHKGHPYTVALPLPKQTPTRQPSKHSSSTSERADHSQEMLLPAELDPFSEQARGKEIHPEHFHGTPGRMRRSVRASNRDVQLDIPNTLQPGVSETQSAMPLHDISLDQRLTQRRGIYPPVSANSAYHGGSHYNTSSPAVKHEAVGTQFIVPDPAPSTIQVTIGRIEVRATPPPPSQSQGKRSPSSVMNLDQYLHQRAKGGDR